jgi:hypothetical protein
MAQTTLVEIQVRDGQRLIDLLGRNGVDITAAAWIHEGESGDWYLYLATPLVSENGDTLPAYRRLNEVYRSMRDEELGVDQFEVKMIGPHDPIAEDIAKNRSPRPGKSPRRFTGGRLGELSVEQAWIYPFDRRPTLNRANGS